MKENVKIAKKRKQTVKLLRMKINRRGLEISEIKETESEREREREYEKLKY